MADLLEDERGDLEISSEGLADSDPATTEDDEDPSTFADNSRVEISYPGGTTGPSGTPIVEGLSARG